MAIDMHVHLSVAPDGKVLCGPEGLLSIMDKNAVSGSVMMSLMGLFSNFTDHKTENTAIAEFCKKAPGRFYPSFTVNPLSSEEAVDEVKRCVNELNVKILKLHPWLQGFSITYEQMDKVAEVCQELGVTILFHDGTPPYATPLQEARLAREYPELKIVSGHSGLNDLWTDAVLAAKRYPNYYLSFCGSTTGQMQQIVDQIPPEQICVGSDLILGAKMDFCDDEDAMWFRWQAWRKVKVSDEAREIIENQTAKKLLNIK